MPRMDQVDPSRTITIRRSFSNDMDRRFQRVAKLIREFVYKDDAFGLKPSPVINVVPERTYQFRSDPEKIEAFRIWLKEQTDAGILTTDAGDKPWLAKYVESAYKKGKVRSYREKYGPLVDSPIGLQMTQDGRLLGLSLAFIGPAEIRRVEAIYTRAWTDLKGINDVMAQQLSRTLSLGFAQGQNPLEIAREMVKQVNGLSIKRAQLIAQTETIAAHAEGQLDGYEELQVKELIIKSEWLTAGDDRVCLLCSAQSGRVYSLDEARGLIPMHPKCRCCWAPYTEVAK